MSLKPIINNPLGENNKTLNITCNNIECSNITIDTGAISVDTLNAVDVTVTNRLEAKEISSDTFVDADYVITNTINSLTLPPPSSITGYQLQNSDGAGAMAWVNPSVNSFFDNALHSSNPVVINGCVNINELGIGHFMKVGKNVVMHLKVRLDAIANQLQFRVTVPPAHPSTTGPSASVRGVGVASSIPVSGSGSSFVLRDLTINGTGTEVTLLWRTSNGAGITPADCLQMPFNISISYIAQ